jgi:hypothetical protein
MPRSEDQHLARALAGAGGGLAGAFVMSRVPMLRRVDDRATALVSDAAAERMHAPLTRERLRRLIPLVRYTFGMTAGAAYGLITGNSHAASTGAAWGAVLWVISDFVVLPALASSPPRDPAGRTALSLTGHLVYGVTTGLVARSIRTAVGVGRASDSLRGTAGDPWQ